MRRESKGQRFEEETVKTGTLPSSFLLLLMPPSTSSFFFPTSPDSFLITPSETSAPSSLFYLSILLSIRLTNQHKIFLFPFPVPSCIPVARLCRSKSAVVFIGQYRLQICLLCCQALPILSRLLPPPSLGSTHHAKKEEKNTPPLPPFVEEEKTRRRERKRKRKRETTRQMEEMLEGGRDRLTRLMKTVRSVCPFSLART
mmetsp:Transcript_26072/g.51150  ORF Transcript_26072/g.51150 Transcript_26072/m.51150 type:complete len:200 (+) Transcript_26072:1245-1844(+)